ncbi:MAG: cation transporter [Candidatus Cloacimonetes bacterium]|nr:cation transporter [Candidatus Cloacimonadota bacterium]
MGGAWILTLVAVLTSNSVAILADFVNSTLQIMSVGLAWFVDIKFSSRKNPFLNYGPGKIESITSIVIGIVFFISIVGLSIVAVTRFINPAQVSGTGVWIILIFALIFSTSNAYLFFKTKKEFKTTGKSHLDGESRIYLIKAISNFGFFFSILISAFAPFKGAVYFDPGFSCFVIGLMFVNMLQLFKKNLPTLFDYAISEATQMEVTKVLAKYFDLYEHYGGMRSRHTGNNIYIELFLAFNKDLTMGQVLEYIKVIEKDIEELIPHSKLNVICSDERKRGDI